MDEALRADLGQELGACIGPRPEGEQAGRRTHQERKPAFQRQQLHAQSAHGQQEWPVARVWCFAQVAPGQLPQQQPWTVAAAAPLDTPLGDHYGPLHFTCCCCRRCVGCCCSSLGGHCSRSPGRCSRTAEHYFEQDRRTTGPLPPQDHRTMLEPARGTHRTLWTHGAHGTHVPVRCVCVCVCFCVVV